MLRWLVEETKRKRSDLPAQLGNSDLARFGIAGGENGRRGGDISTCRRTKINENARYRMPVSLFGPLHVPECSLVRCMLARAFIL